jgi:hypothetical protein
VRRQHNLTNTDLVTHASIGEGQTTAAGHCGWRIRASRSRPEAWLTTFSINDTIIELEVIQIRNIGHKGHNGHGVFRDV